MIFKLCGSPSPDYFKKLKLTTSYRPTQHYKPSFHENFQKFPSSSLGLLATFLDLNPAHRGNAASALQSDVSFFFLLIMHLAFLLTSFYFD